MKTVETYLPRWMRREHQPWLEEGYWERHLWPLCEQIEINGPDKNNFHQYLLGFAQSVAREASVYLMSLAQIYSVHLSVVFGLNSLEKGRENLAATTLHALTDIPDEDRNQVEQLFSLIETTVEGELQEEERKQLILQGQHRLLGLIKSFLGIQDVYLRLYERKDSEFGRPHLRFSREHWQWDLDYAYPSLLYWLSLMTTPDYWRPACDEAYFFYIDTDEFPRTLPRMFQVDKGMQMYTIGFGGRLGIFNSQHLPFELMGRIWDWMLVEQGVYESNQSDKQKRDFVLAQFIPLVLGADSWIDMAGGKGDLVATAGKLGWSGEVSIIDGSHEALVVVKDRGIQGYQADLRRPLDGFGDAVTQRVTISYAAHLLGLTVFNEAWRLLKPNGKLIVNHYPKDEEHLQETINYLQSIGFEVIPHVFTFARAIADEHGPEGETSEEVIIEAVKSG